jgi:hypothetical protein
MRATTGTLNFKSQFAHLVTIFSPDFFALSRVAIKLHEHFIHLIWSSPLAPILLHY